MDLWKKGLGMAGIAIVAVCVGATQVHADTITTLYNTGVDGFGSPLADGSSDLHYTLTLSADSCCPAGNPAIVAFPIPAAGVWVPNGPFSKWISPSVDQTFPDPSGLSGNADGNYTYTTTFFLSSELDPNTASISGQWATDNAGLDIVINTTSTGYIRGVAAYGSFTPFTIDNVLFPGAFNSGLNTLQFLTNNAPCSECGVGGVGGNTTGARVEMIGTASPLPEPASLVLLGFGLAALGLWGRKRLSQ